MLNTSEKTVEFRDALFLDISGDVCPMTFVRTKLLIERMSPGETATVRLAGFEPLNNVPQAVLRQGVEVISLEPESAAEGPAGLHRLRIRKR
ncbi:MAG TPA: sulfurtransferase TusA family protein [Defluviicoccus sp.]|nr:sulfurtransferase TusA family protein [Defluviicoccus sp.]